MPPSARQFVPVWQPLDAERTYRSKEYGPSRKRKRQAPLDDSDDDASFRSRSPQSQSLRQSHHASLLDATKDPYHVAGHPVELPLPDRPFPHAPVKEPRLDRNPDTLHKSLASLKPPLYAPPPPEDEDHKTSLRRHHLSVMTTIMHVSLLKGDFVRAGRAWGMILRTEVLGRPIDVRTNDRWGIGAVILMRQHPEEVAKLDRGDEPISEDDQANPGESAISDEGFRLAKDYFERLILQFPFQKTHPHAVSSLHFYPAMYGLCIYEIQQKHNRAIRQADRISPSPSSAHHSDEDNEGSALEGISHKTIATIKQSVLDQVIALADRMRETMMGAYYSQYQPLVRLRTEIAQWIVDLCEELARVDKQAGLTYSRRSEDEKRVASDGQAKLRDLPSTSDPRRVEATSDIQ